MAVYVPLPGSKRTLLPNSRPAGPVDPSEVQSITVRVRSGGDPDALAKKAYDLASTQSVGFLNPFLYSNVAKGVVHDVTSGTNAITKTIKGYKAGPGWDACTGLGTPDGTAILNNLL
jgi:hypothetical protein